MEKLLRLISASLLILTATQANAALFGITYSYEEVSDWTASIPMINGVLTDPGIVPSNGRPPFTPIATPTWGTGTIDTATGDITLNPINYELVIASGSVGYLGWAQTIHGSFLSTTHTMTDATVNGGSLVCSYTASSGCLKLGNNNEVVGDDEGSLPQALILDNDATILFTALAIGGTGTYFSAEEIFIGVYFNRTINMEIVSEVPAPAAVWLLGSGLLGLAGLARKRRGRQ